MSLPYGNEISVNKVIIIINVTKRVTVIGASLSEPHTSKLSGTSVAFTKIHEVLRINGFVRKRLRLKNG